MSPLYPSEQPTPLAYFSALVQSDAHFPLLEAVVCLAQDADPQLDVLGVLAKVDAWLDRLRQRTRGDTDQLVLLRRVNLFFFDELGFAGNVNDYYHPDNSFLHRVVQTRRGIPISLAVLWLELAQGLGLQAHGVAFPGHFLVKVLLPDPHEGQIILDPFTGQSLGRDDLLGRLGQWLGEPALAGGRRQVDVILTQHLQPCSPRKLVGRMLYNLQEIYRASRNTQAAQAVQQRLAILDNTGLHRGAVSGDQN